MFEYWRLVSEVLIAYSWPLALFVIFCMSKGELFALLRRDIEIQNGAIKIILKNTIEKAQLSKIEATRLKNLRGEDIWSLGTIKGDQGPPVVIFNQMKPALKVQSLRLSELGLVKIENNGLVNLTSLGNTIYDEANNLTGKQS